MQCCGQKNEKLAKKPEQIVNLPAFEVPSTELQQKSLFPASLKLYFFHLDGSGQLEAKPHYFIAPNGPMNSSFLIHTIEH